MASTDILLCGRSPHSRRRFLRQMGAVAAWGAIAASARAADLSTGPAAPFVLVELFNFHCPRCRTVNDHFDRIAAAAKSAGSTLRAAPVAWEGQSPWPDRVLYAVRDLYSGDGTTRIETLVRGMLFDGIQQEGQRFDEIPQVLAYFTRRKLPELALALNPNFSLVAIADYAASDATLLSEAKAGRLLDLAGATEVPVFVWVRGGDVVAALSPADAADPVALVQLVLKKLTAV